MRYCGLRSSTRSARCRRKPPAARLTSAAPMTSAGCGSAARVYLDEPTITHAPGAEPARRPTSSPHQQHQSMRTALHEIRHSRATGCRIKDGAQEHARVLGTRRATKDLHKPADPSWHIGMTIALITSAVVVIALLITLGRRRRATRSAEDRAVAYMQVRHGHYWQPPDEPAEETHDAGDRAGPTAGRTHSTRRKRSHTRQC
jgi:hypothetical protein